MGLLDLRKVSYSSELKSILLIVCIDAPESASNSRSSEDVEVGAGAIIITLFSLSSIEE